MVVNSHPLYQLSYRGSEARPRPDTVLYSNRIFVLPAFNDGVAKIDPAGFGNRRTKRRVGWRNTPGFPGASGIRHGWREKQAGIPVVSAMIGVIERNFDTVGQDHFGVFRFA